MTTKADFTEEEWARLGRAPLVAGMAITLADPGGPVPRRHRPGRRDQPDDRAGDPPGHGEPGEQREQGGQPGRAGDGAQQRGLQAAVGGVEPGTGGPHQRGARSLAAGVYVVAPFRRCSRSPISFLFLFLF